MKQNKNKNTNNMNANKIAQNSSVVWQFGLVGELRLQRHQRGWFLLVDKDGISHFERMYAFE